VEAHLARSFRLGDAARAVGASPAYLTDVFRRFEGMPLHRYAQRSRLSRALVELPHAGDLTSLALELGFSSHSHFAAVFRRTFGCTPSEFRQNATSSPAIQRMPGDGKPDASWYVLSKRFVTRANGARCSRNRGPVPATSNLT
jgi:AraC-like DNA-binding protein